MLWLWVTLKVWTVTWCEIANNYKWKGYFMKKEYYQPCRHRRLQRSVGCGAADRRTKLWWLQKVWSDEFNGDSLNRADWNVEIHEKGWVNNELQEYVDSAENIQVKDGKLIINPVKKVTDGDTGSTKEAASYTSGRVSTQNKQTFIYGRFECRAKVPKEREHLHIRHHLTSHFTLS